jgi:CelD/BcsL family acetyltransferase involved in cellulose biosynthesis
LWAAREGITFPAFGAVSAENSGLAGPEGVEATHPSSLDTAAIFESVRSLASILRDLTVSQDADGVARVVTARIQQLRERL